MRSKLVMILVVLIIVLFIASLVISQDKRIIKPIRTESDIILRPSAWDLESKLPDIERKMVQTSYVCGFWDALTLVEAKAPAIEGLFSAYEGMDIEQIVETMNKFYKDNPQWRDLKPAIVMMTVMPRLRKGLSPLPVTNK